MKAKLTILLIIASMFLISSAIAADVCCEKLTSDDYCVYTDEASCDSNFKDAAVSCEQTSFCKPGCCYSSNEGECYKNVARAECTSIEGTTWAESAGCEIPQCQKGCCLLGSQGFFVTEVKCKLETSEYGNVNMEWKPEILSEPECQAVARSQDMGCCVIAEGCTFTTRESCTTASTTPTTTNQTGQEDFYKDMLCSNDLLSCGCAKQTNTGCYDDKVYWLDSCGNRENVYSSDETKSYNNGYVLEPDSVCNSPAILSTSCGNCDYGQGSICRSVSSIETISIPEFGDFICSKTSCDSTYDDTISPSAGEAKKNGESWCLYDSQVGHARDLVGSRHYRRLCINGEEMVEPCTDYREEICVQGVLGEGTTTTYTAFSATGDYVEAACRDNRWEDCYDCNSVAAGCGVKCSGAKAKVDCHDCDSDQKDEVKKQANKLAVRLCCTQKCCEKEELRDCYYLSGTKTSGKPPQVVVKAEKGQITSVTNIGNCVPQVPPGLKFWPTGTTNFPTSTTRSSPATTAAVTTGTSATGTSTTTSSTATTVCSQASQECKVKWWIGGTGKLGIGGITTQKDYECVQNCHCMKKEWVIGGNTLCKAQGDCGAYFNILGKSNLDGYANTASTETEGSQNLYFDGYTLLSKDIVDWKKLMAPGGSALSLKGKGAAEFLSVEGMKGYASEFGLPLTVFIAIGIRTYAIGGSFYAGTTGGLSILSEAVTGARGAAGAKATEIFGKQYTDGQVLDPSSTFSKSVVKDAGYQPTTTYSAPSGSAHTVSPAGNVYKTSDLLLEDATPGYSAPKLTPSEIKNLDSTQIKTGSVCCEGFTKNADGTLTPKTGTEAKGKMGAESGGGSSTISTVMWLYTIYKLIDVFLADEKDRTYSISCSPWVAPEGGSDCEECNDDPEKPCSIYRCKSLGQNCYLINQGTSDEACVDMNPNDVNSPVIEPWEEVIPADYTITQTSLEGNKGYKINEKIGPYDSITLGIETDEPSQCKFIDKVGTDFDTMTTYFGESQYLYEQQITFVIPAEFTTREALRATGDTYNLYIRCKDAAGNKNERDYFIRFTLKPEPDMMAPGIERTSIEKGAYIMSDIIETDFTIYVNERAECKYSTIDKEYGLMEEDFECLTSAFTANSVFNGLYECETTLDLNVTDYKWYLRCKDTADNKNKESYKFSLTPTEALEITSIGPEGTFYEPEITLKATTARGAENGKATCAYSYENETLSNMVLFLNTDSTLHEQILTPGTGEFTYYVKCIDAAGNIAGDSTTFTLDVDLIGPKILYIYVTPSNYLHLEMDEASTCEYSTETFVFGEGKEMTGSGTTIHDLSVTEKSYNIICQDIYYNEASFIVYP